MAKYTLIEVVQAYLNATDGFPANSIDDSFEAQQVADIAEDVYYEIINDIRDWGINRELIQLDSVADSTKPNYLLIPDDVIRIHETKLKYNKAVNTAGSTTLLYKDVDYMEPNAFLDFVNGRSTNESNTEIITDYSSVQFVIKNNAAPSKFTSFDDKHIVTDSYDSAVDSVLQKSKTQALVTKNKDFTKQDSWVIDLPEWFQVHYLQLVKARASEYLREEPLLTDFRKGNAGLIKARYKHGRVGNSNTGFGSKRKVKYGRR